MSNKTTPLAQPVKIGKRTAKNRFCINAMECCDGNDDGTFSPLTYERYDRLFDGDAGVIVFEAVTLQTESRARNDQLVLNPSDPKNRKCWEDWVKAIKTKYPDPILIVQLNHSGEVSGSSFSERVCVKPLYGFGGKVIGAEYCDHVIDMFVNATKFLYDIGVDGVDLKFCHGYFGNQVLRPYNDRVWKYGGPWENRSRFAFDMIEKARKAVNDDNFIIGSKVSMYEGFPGGLGSAGPDTPIMDLTESIDLVKGLEERGANFILQSSGNPSVTMELHMPNKKKPDDVYFHFTMAKIIKENMKNPDTCVIGGAYSVLNDGHNMLKAVEPERNNMFYWGNYNIEHGYADMIALGRQSFADPYLPKKYCEDRDDEIKWCVNCDNCVELLIRQTTVGCCVHNPYYAKVIQDLWKTKGKLRRRVTGEE